MPSFSNNAITSHIVCLLAIEGVLLGVKANRRVLKVISKAENV